MKILKRALLALALAFSLSSTAQPAAAWGPMNGRWHTNGAVYYCEGIPGSTFPYRSMWNTLKEGFARWNGLGTINLVETTNTTVCKIRVYYTTGFDTPATTAVHIDGSGYIYASEIFFNRNVGGSFWWYGATQSCYVGVAPGCNMDAWTIATHEMGHAIGLTHNTLPPTDQRCSSGYYSNAGSTNPPCWSYGTAIMHWNSGAEFINAGIPGAGYQGYRHLYLSSDDLGAFHQAY